MKQKLSQFIGNSFYCKLFFIILPFLNEIPLLTNYTVSFLKLGIVWGGLYLLYDLFHERNTLKAPGIVPMTVLILAMTIGSAMHWQSALLKMNIIEILYTIITVGVLYPSPSKGKEYQEMSVINSIFVTLVTVASLISVIMFFTKTQIEVEINGYLYRLGVFNGRLVGVYRNSIYPTALLGMFCAFIQLLINKTVLNTKKYNKLLIAAIAVNAVAVILQNSKGLFIGFLGSAAVFGFFAAYRILYQKSRTKIPGRIGASAVASGLSAGAGIGVLALLRKVNVLLLNLIELIKNRFAEEPVSAEQIAQNVESFVQREVSTEYGALTGRPYVWKSGLKWTLQQPLFGYGPYTLANDIHPYEGSTEQLSHFHNVFVQALASGGIIGFAGFAYFTVCCICRLARTLFTDCKRRDYLPFLMICTMLSALLIINMADTTILFMTKQSGYLFFIFLGYAMSLSGENRQFRIDRPAQWLAGHLSGKNR